ncbi:hypothetical protein V8G54_030470 [Vigna mungo]|uniref:Uncharacterized protein n=1 Tax=Vigna mungo TaxID=3915 RepID=A0AAQ3MV71_VIGMU
MSQLFKIKLQVLKCYLCIMCIEDILKQFLFPFLFPVIMITRLFLVITRSRLVYPKKIIYNFSLLFKSCYPQCLRKVSYMINHSPIPQTSIFKRKMKLNIRMNIPCLNRK